MDTVLLATAGDGLKIIRSADEAEYLKLRDNDRARAGNLGQKKLILGSPDLAENEIRVPPHAPMSMSTSSFLLSRP
jgi:hypothetical protein